MNKDAQKNLFLAINMVAGFGGLYIGYLTINKYELLQRGILGGTILVLLYLTFFRSKDLSLNLNRPIEFQKDIIYIPVTIFLSVLVYWVISDISNMVMHYF